LIFAPTLVTSAEAADDNGFLATTFETTLGGFIWAAGQELFVRWALDDVSGAGARYEFAIDDVLVEVGESGESGDGGGEAGAFTLGLLHFADQEASTATLVDAPNFSAVLNALEAQDLGGDGLPDNTLILSSGDASLPSPFFDNSEGAFGSAGIAEFLFQNELGVQAMAVGNHEFDKGPDVFADLVDGSATFDPSAETLVRIAVQ
jgi:hypothetical protein